ncbi:MAG TPA: YoaK family protein [Chthoniobacterales bacterium]|nr:YoaK family protein [Chthoniobacterales bacterium]
MTLDWNQTRAEWAVAILLAMIAGYLDGYGLLFFGTYVSLMSENTTRSGQGDFHAAFSSAVAILFFVTGSFLGNLFSQSRLRPYRIVFGLITSEVATVAGFEWTGLRNVYFEIALLSLAMVHDQSSFI